MYPHRIRLRGPWDCEPLPREGSDLPLPSPRRVTMPCRWAEAGLGDFTGQVRCRRRFGFPGRLESYDRVWLTCAGHDGVAEVWLNGERLGRFDGAAGAFELEVTRLLRPRNELVVEVAVDGGAGGLWGEVALEVRCTAYLENVRVVAEGASGETTLRVRGRLVGTSERPLDFYVLLDGATVVYAPLEPDPAGRAFDFTARDFAPRGDGAGVVRVELVNGAVVWYALEREIRFGSG